MRHKRAATDIQKWVKTRYDIPAENNNSSDVLFDIGHNDTHPNVQPRNIIIIPPDLKRPVKTKREPVYLKDCMHHY